jgi:hypothetical protein
VREIEAKQGGRGMVRMRREVFPYLVAVTPLALGLLIFVAALVIGGSMTSAHTLPLPQPGPVGP